MSQFEDIENALKSACINYQETLSWDGVFKNGIKLDNNIFFAFDTVGNLLEVTTIIEGKIVSE